MEDEGPLIGAIDQGTGSSRFLVRTMYGICRSTAVREGATALYCIVYMHEPKQ